MSVTPRSSRLAFPFENLGSHYDAVVVGSGYGASIAASRLARAGQRVCVLERGREFQPGEYPDTTVEAAAQFQMDNEHGHFGSKTGLFDFRANKDIGVFLGCGLGGTSLVNAGVVLPAEPRVLADPVWPQALRDDVDGMRDGYTRAAEMLKPSSYPDDFPPLEKLAALEQAGDHLGERFYRPPINVNYEPDGVNHVGVYQRTCRLCGDCVSGCNYAAKNTLIMNYLPDARNHGAEIYTQLKVSHVERRDGRWLVHFEPVDFGREVFNAPEMFVSADIVVLGAGALGSTEILLRSHERGLPLSGVARHPLQRQRRLPRVWLQHRPSRQRDRLRRPRRAGAQGRRPVHHRDHRHPRPGRPRSGARDRGRRDPRRDLRRALEGLRDRRGDCRRRHRRGRRRLLPGEEARAPVPLRRRLRRRAAQHAHVPRDDTRRLERAGRAAGRSGPGGLAGRGLAADLHPRQRPARAGNDRARRQLRQEPDLDPALRPRPGDRPPARRLPDGRGRRCRASSTTRAASSPGRRARTSTRASMSWTARSSRARSASIRSSRSPPWPSGPAR